MILAFLVCACSATESESGVSYTVPSHSDVVSEQREFFADGAISREEYELAFERFAECAKGRGAKVTVEQRDRGSGLIAYSTSEEVVARRARVLDANGRVISIPENATNTCYQRLFDDVELAYALGTMAGQVGD